MHTYIGFLHPIATQHLVVLGLTIDFWPLQNLYGSSLYLTLVIEASAKSNLLTPKLRTGLQVRGDPGQLLQQQQENRGILKDPVAAQLELGFLPHLRLGGIFHLSKPNVST